MKKRIYIACPMGKGDRLHNIRQADRAMAELMTAGYSPFNPALSFWAGNSYRVPHPMLNGGTVVAEAGHESHTQFGHFTHADWLSVDKAWVAVADAVLRLPGESMGADEETTLADQLRIPVFHSIADLRQHFEADTEVCWPNRSPGWWDLHFLRLAEQVAKASKDPSTRVGAVIAEGKDFISCGYNGFAPGCDDSPELYADREVKLGRVLHAELNAILSANRPLDGCTIYTVPFQPCERCAGPIIRKKIKRVVAPVCPPDIRQRWAKSLDSAERQFREAGVKLDLIG